MEENIREQFVVDASFVINYLLPDEKNPQSDFVFQEYARKNISLISNQLLPFEVLNSLRYAVLRKRIASSFAENMTTFFFDLYIVCYPVDMYQTFLFAQKNNLTVYDASYVWLAKEKGIKLLTFDTRLQQLPLARKII